MKKIKFLKKENFIRVLSKNELKSLRLGDRGPQIPPPKSQGTIDPTDPCSGKYWDCMANAKTPMEEQQCYVEYSICYLANNGH
jgi:hypothetical protein